MEICELGVESCIKSGNPALTKLNPICGSSRIGLKLIFSIADGVQVNF